MATQILKGSGWEKNTIVEVIIGKTKYEYDGKTFNAKNGVIWYTQNGSGTTYPWQIRNADEIDRFKDLEVGKTYRVFRKAINTGYQTGYNWEKVVPYEPKSKEPEVSTVQLPDWLLQQQTTRDKLVQAMTDVASLEYNPAIEKLLMLLADQLNEHPELFKW